VRFSNSVDSTDNELGNVLSNKLSKELSKELSNELIKGMREVQRLYQFSSTANSI